MCFVYLRMALKITVPVCILLLNAIACDPEDLQVEAGDSPVESSLAAAPYDETELPAAPLVDTVALGNDVKVSFFELLDGSVGVLVEGPATSHLTEELRAVNTVMSAANGADEAVAMMLELGDALAAGPAMPRNEDLHGNIDGAPQSATGSSLDQLRGPLRPTALACDGVDAFDWAAGWHSANQGNCDTFTRPNGDDQHFEGDDLIAYAGHVVAISGSVFWDIRLQNWGVSGWYWGLQSYAIPQGTQAYWYMSRITNDFNLTTRVEVTSSSATFNHDFARCHDYRHRVVNAGSSVYGGCKINLNGTQVHVNDLNFVASDPSNIPTVIPW